MNDEGTAPSLAAGAVPFLMCGEEGKRPRRFPPHPIRTDRRGASGRRNKGLRVVKYHVPAAGGPSGPKDVVPPDEGTRVCGQ